MSEEAIAGILDYAKTKHYEYCEKIPLLAEQFKIELAEKSEESVKQLPLYPYLHVFFEMVNLYAENCRLGGSRRV